MAKKDSASELRELTLEQLRNRVNDTRQELMNLRFQQSTGELTDTSRLYHTRRLIARLVTILHQREGAQGE